jgi:hypothetical protein
MKGPFLKPLGFWHLRLDRLGEFLCIELGTILYHHEIKARKQHERFSVSKVRLQRNEYLCKDIRNRGGTKSPVAPKYEYKS